jgi:hypothetical protein
VECHNDGSNHRSSDDSGGGDETVRQGGEGAASTTGDQPVVGGAEGAADARGQGDDRHVRFRGRGQTLMATW